MLICCPKRKWKLALSHCDDEMYEDTPTTVPALGFFSGITAPSSQTINVPFFTVADFSDKALIFTPLFKLLLFLQSQKIDLIERTNTGTVIMWRGGNWPRPSFGEFNFICASFKYLWTIVFFVCLLMQVNNFTKKLVKESRCPFSLIRCPKVFNGRRGVDWS